MCAEMDTKAMIVAPNAVLTIVLIARVECVMEPVVHVTVTRAGAVMIAPSKSTARTTVPWTRGALHTVHAYLQAHAIASMNGRGRIAPSLLVLTTATAMAYARTAYASARLVSSVMLVTNHVPIIARGMEPVSKPVLVYVSHYTMAKTARN